MLLRLDRDGDYEIVLYDSGSTVIATLDKDVRGAATEVVDRVLLATAVELHAGQVYRLAVKPSSGTSVAMRSLTLPSSDYCAAEIGGAEFYQSTRTDAGAWSDDQASKPPMALMLAGFAGAAGSRLGGLVG